MTDQCVDMAVRDAADRGFMVTCGRCLRRADRGAPRQRLARVRRLLLDRRHRHDRSALSGDAGGMTGGLTGALTGIVTTDLAAVTRGRWRSEEHTSELQSLMRISYAVFCLKKKKKTTKQQTHTQIQLTLPPITHQ